MYQRKKPANLILNAVMTTWNGRGYHKIHTCDKFSSKAHSILNRHTKHVERLRQLQIGSCSKDFYSNWQCRFYCRSIIRTFVFILRKFLFNYACQDYIPNQDNIHLVYISHYYAALDVWITNWFCLDSLNIWVLQKITEEFQWKGRNLTSWCSPKCKKMKRKLKKEIDNTLMSFWMSLSPQLEDI